MKLEYVVKTLSTLEQFLMTTFLALFVFLRAFINIHILLFIISLVTLVALEVLFLLIDIYKQKKDKQSFVNTLKSIVPTLLKFCCVTLFALAVFFSPGTLFPPIVLIFYFAIRALSTLWEASIFYFYKTENYKEKVVSYFYPHVHLEKGLQLSFNLCYFFVYTLLTIVVGLFFLPMIGGATSGSAMFGMSIILLPVLKTMHFLLSNPIDDHKKELQTPTTTTVPVHNNWLEIPDLRSLSPLAQSGSSGMTPKAKGPPGDDTKGESLRRSIVDNIC